MEHIESQRGEQTAGHEPGMTPESAHTQRRSDRRDEGIALFGGYEGPERRSGRDRRGFA